MTWQKTMALHCLHILQLHRALQENLSRFPAKEQGNFHVCSIDTLTYSEYCCCCLLHNGLEYFFLTRISTFYPFTFPRNNFWLSIQLIFEDCKDLKNVLKSIWMQRFKGDFNKDFEPNCVLPTAKLNILRQVYHDKHVSLKIIFGGIWLTHLQP